MTSRSISHLVRSVVVQAPLRLTTRGVLSAQIHHSASTLKSLDEEDHQRRQESSFEKEFVSRQEKEVLRKLVRNISKADDPGDQQARKTLAGLFAKHGIQANELFVKDLLTWKHQGE